MKITSLNAYPGPDEVIIDIAVRFEGGLSVAYAVSSVLALFAGTTSAVAQTVSIDRSVKPVVVDTSHIGEGIRADEAAAEAPAAPAAEPATKASRTRRPRTNPDAAPAAEIPPHVPQKAEEERAAQMQPTEQRRRTRVTAEPAQPEVKVITDADLAKACSNAAAVIGIEVVQAVIADFHVKSMQELAADVRERFLAELNDEIELAKAELAGGK